MLTIHLSLLNGMLSVAAYWPKTLVSDSYRHQSPLEGLLKHRFLGPIPSWFIKSGWRPRICTSNQFPGDVGSASLRTTLPPRVQLACGNPSESWCLSQNISCPPSPFSASSSKSLVRGWIGWDGEHSFVARNFRLAWIHLLVLVGYDKFLSLRQPTAIILTLCLYPTFWLLPLMGPQVMYVIVLTLYFFNFWYIWTFLFF